MQIFALLLSVLATSSIDAISVDVVNNTACHWSSNACLPSSLCEATGDATQPCQVKKDAEFLPQQLHLAYAGKASGTGMTLSWATYAEMADSAVWIGSSEDSLELLDTPVAHVSYYHDETYTMFHHHATVSGLTPHTKYFYKVGSQANTTFTSDVYSFVTARAASDNSTFNMVIYGDFGPGDESKDTLTYVNTLSSNEVDFVYHIGDVGYADASWLMPGRLDGFFYEKVYNEWMNSVAPVMSSVPYMVVVGNHEAECHSLVCGASREKVGMLGNYSAYNARFKMPSEEVGGVLNMWFSFEQGPIHFTSLSAETDYPDAPTNGYTEFSSNGNFGNQLEWAEADLKKAAANRANVPWIIVGMHRPIYDLAFHVNGTPSDQGAFLQAAFEELFIKYEVDVVITGHEHCYQRQTPIRNSTAVLDGVSSDFKTYRNPAAPVYIVSGSGGGVEGLDAAPDSTNVSWNVVSNYADYGFSTLEANRSMLSWKFLNSSNQAILDEFVMWKTAPAAGGCKDAARTRTKRWTDKTSSWAFRMN